MFLGKSFKNILDTQKKMFFRTLFWKKNSKKILKHFSALKHFPNLKKFFFQKSVLKEKQIF